MRVLTVLGLALCAAPALLPVEDKVPEKLRVYVGTYTRGTKSGGIYRMDLDLATGKLSEPVDASNKFAFVADLGLDKVLIYKFDPAKGTLTSNDPPEVKLAPGAGPRHFAFHPNGKYAYVINEIDMTVSAMAYDPTTGKLEVI